MQDERLEQALERADFALRRITRSLENRPTPAAAPAPAGGDEVLREKVRAAIAELDQLIREAAD
jgi:hypothetical protein